MDWRKPKSLNQNAYDLPGNWLLIHYFEAINVLFRVENALRIFVYIVLKMTFKDKWKNLSITSDDEENSTISAIAKRRLSQDKNYAYLGYIIDNPLLYLTSGELIRIITSDAYWRYFKSYFLGSREIIKTKLDEIGNVRNAVAHFRPIKEGDLDLVKQNANHTLSKIEDTIIELLNCVNSTPSNTEEDWYKRLSTLRDENYSIEFTQSKDEAWVKLTLVFSLHKINAEPYYRITRANILNIKTDSLLKEYPLLTKYLISVSEIKPSNHIKDITSFDFVKKINLIFNREMLIHEYEKIEGELKKILLQINSETDLIARANLARGRLVESVSVPIYERGTEEDRYFVGDIRELVSIVKVDSVAEYWGDLCFASQDFISDTERYPWINVRISDDKTDFPF